MNNPVECPVCGGGLDLPEDAVQGELITCPECNSELELVTVSPLKLEEAPGEAEDWGE
ncbi:MAG TPA: lysine biosynthesis protein LysW [Candidatus Aminicenantes bacterium]|nr:lysine biosynthesis protein LysW [Candidatus Aminicenantes bacterium]